MERIKIVGRARDATAGDGAGGETLLAPRQPPLYLGIDPGAGGAIASLDAEGRLVAVEDMPTCLVKVGRTDRRRVSASLLRDLLAADGDAITMIVLERVGGMTGQSASASFTFGYGCGLVEGVIAALSLPVVMVTPQAWKRSAGIPAAKGAAREAAMRLWPAWSSKFARVKDDGRAEACLLARHGWLSVARARAA